MKPLFTTVLSALRFQYHQPPPRRWCTTNLKLVRPTDCVGLEPYYLAECIRELCDIFRTPSHVMVCHLHGNYRHVRVQLPNPIGPHLAHWIQRACLVYQWDAFSSRVEDFRQFYYLGRVVQSLPEGYEFGYQDEVCIAGEAPEVSRTHRVAPAPLATCTHGLAINAWCRACEDELPW